VADLDILLLVDRDEAVFLAVDATLPEGTRDELRIWARTEVDVADGNRSLDAVLSLEGLVIAASTGVVGNAAWSAFPAAAHWLSGRIPSDDAPSLLDVAERMRECLATLGTVPADLDIADLRQDRDGRWLGEFHCDGVRYRITADATGRILRVRRHDGAG
jgi:hypothetical protein